MLLIGFWGIEGFREQYLNFGAAVRVWEFLTWVWDSGIRDLELVNLGIWGLGEWVDENVMRGRK